MRDGRVNGRAVIGAVRIDPLDCELLTAHPCWFRPMLRREQTTLPSTSHFSRHQRFHSANLPPWRKGA
jgi:hypothetical protein